MSAGMMPAAAEPQPSRDLGLLAPKFALAVDTALAECNAAGLDAIVFEAYRSPELQAIYYARGRTVKPPYQTVTNARSNLHSWHGFGLAVDVIHRTLLWGPPATWWRDLAEIFKRHGCDWGGDWVRVDMPHFQWGTLRKSPSDRARQLLAQGGLIAVWREVGAAGPAGAIPKPKPRLLTKGVKGADVLALQNRLVELGYLSAAQRATGPGTFGPATDEAVRTFQASKGLRADGDVGPDTRAALSL